MSKWIRQIHRWLSMAFTAGFIVNIIAFVQPYAAKRHGARGAGGQG